ncbi:MAG: Uracil-DNA glycosylase [Planctomycetota bacterium]
MTPATRAANTLPAWVPHKLPEDWHSILASPSLADTFRQLDDFLRHEWQTAQVFPPAPAIFRALLLTPRKHVSVVIVGQDPYHDDAQANGLAFAVDPPLRLPPSLRNIQRELQQDLGLQIPPELNLEHWARQGVLLLNTILTVRAHQPHSHRGKGWEEITSSLLQAVNHGPPTAFILWGAPAATLARQLLPHHFVITSPHPSPLSAYRGFFGSRPFSKVNAFLQQHGRKPIDWTPGL